MLANVLPPIRCDPRRWKDCSMHRMTARGVGFAAAAVAATSLAVGATTAAADPKADPHPTNNGVEAVVDGVPTGFELSTIHRMHGHAIVGKMNRWRSAQDRVAVARAKAARAARAAQLAAAHRAAARRAAADRASRAYVRSLTPGSARALGASMVAARGWSTSQFACLDSMWTHESNWRVNAYNASSGAYGIPQAQPGSKMAGYGSDWRTNAATQIAWGLSYIASRYGSPCSAWAFWQNNHWY
jgi:hypothetical protein